MATLQDTVDQATAGSIAGMTVLPGRVQPEGTTGQLAPQVAEAPQEPPTPKAALDLEEPVVSPTVISTDSLRTQLDQAQTKLNTLKQETQPQSEVPQQQLAEAPVETGQEVDYIAAYQKETDKLLRDRERQFDKYLTRSSSLLKSQVSSIKKQFDVRRQSAEQVAANAKAASSVLGARTGRLRYAPEIQQGIITGQENALIITLSEIDALEAAAIAAAEGAAFERDYDTFIDKIDELDSIQKEREKTLDELTAAMEEENQRRQDEAERAKFETQIIEQISNGTTDPIAIFTALNGQAPYDLIVEYTSTVPKKDFEFIKGDKYNATGYFDSSTGEFVKISGGYAVGEGGEVSYGGPLTINGQVIGDVTSDITLDQIDMLNISENAKSYVRLYKEGRLTQDEILQRLAGDKTDRNLRNEVIGVIARMQQPMASLDSPASRTSRQKAELGISTVDNVLAIFEPGGFLSEMFDTSNTAAGRALLSWLPGSKARDLAAQIDTLSGMISFDELQTMRDNSPTGGALGQVTERELALLAAQRGSLDVGQSGPQLKRSLEQVRKSFLRVKMINDPNTTTEAYKQAFPDATEGELSEIKARNAAQVQISAPLQTNASLLGVQESPLEEVPTELSSL